MTGAAGGAGRNSVGSGEPAGARPEPVADVAAVQRHQREPPLRQCEQQPALQTEASGGLQSCVSGGWSPRKQPRPQQQKPGTRGGAAAPTQPSRPARQAPPVQAAVSRHGMAAASRGTAAVPALALDKLAGGRAAAPAAPRSARAPAPARAAAVPAMPLTARPPAPSAPGDDSAELDSAELDARRAQQLVDWGTLLVQSAATVAAERVLLGPAAPQVGGVGGRRASLAACCPLRDLYSETSTQSPACLPCPDRRRRARR